MQINFSLPTQVFRTFISCKFRVTGQPVFPSGKIQGHNKTKGRSRRLTEISQPRLSLNLYSYSVGGFTPGYIKLVRKKVNLTLFKHIQTLTWRSALRALSLAQLLSPPFLRQMQHALLLNFVHWHLQTKISNQLLN